jgi:hypothetical protein
VELFTDSYIDCFQTIYHGAVLWQQWVIFYQHDQYGVFWLFSDCLPQNNTLTVVGYFLFILSILTVFRLFTTDQYFDSSFGSYFWVFWLFSDYSPRSSTLTVVLDLILSIKFWLFSDYSPRSSTLTVVLDLIFEYFDCFQTIHHGAVLWQQWVILFHSLLYTSSLQLPASVGKMGNLHLKQ